VAANGPQGIQLVVAYDGSGFSGWQLQPGRRTVQGELERAAEALAGHPVRMRAACRTDAGVHALGQVVAFDSRRELRPRNWVMALNQALPSDVAVRSARLCPPGSQPRWQAREKTYRYLLHLGFARNPLFRDRAWHLGKLVRRVFPDTDRTDNSSHRLDIPAMREAALELTGKHDFSAFRASDDSHRTTVRTIHQVRIIEGFQDSTELLAIEVRGTAFLKNMVRIMAGTLVEVGRGRLGAKQVASLLGPDARRVQAGETAPAHGLTLVSVELGRERER
jgi:tRNA pseudouridine38-40 synthase